LLETRFLRKSLAACRAFLISFFKCTFTKGQESGENTLEYGLCKYQKFIYKYLENRVDFFKERAYNMYIVKHKHEQGAVI
jgi:hypothetical protein